MYSICPGLRPLNIQKHKAVQSISLVFSAGQGQVFLKRQPTYTTKSCPTRTSYVGRNVCMLSQK